MKKVIVGMFLVMSVIAGCGGGDSAAPVAAAPTVNVTGAWQGSYTSSVFGSRTASLNLIQNGSNVTGTYANSMGGLGNISGTVSGDTASFTISVTSTGCTGSFSGSGTVSGNTMAFSYNGATNAACGGNESGTGNLTKQ